MFKTDEVDLFMEKLEHPFKREVELLRSLIKEIDKNILEQIKWNAPSFSYKDYKNYLMTFNLRDECRLHIVVHHPDCIRVTSKLLEGDYYNRRMIYFANKADIINKKQEFEAIVIRLIEMS